MKSLLFSKKPLVVMSIATVLLLVLAACSPNTNIPVTGNEFGTTPGSDLNTNVGNLNTNLNANTNANANMNANANANENMNANTNDGTPTVRATTAVNANANTNANANANANTNANTNAGGIPVTGGSMLAVATDPTLGEYLVDSEGMTLYIFTKDQPGVSNCDAACLAQWPPLLAEGESMSTTPGAGNTNAGNTNAGNTNVTGAGTPTVAAGANTNTGNANTNASGAMMITVTTAGIDQTLLGTAELTDGRTIVTYNDWPLYYYVQDKNPGEVRGQGVGGVWWLLTPDGEPIQGMMEAGTSEPGNANSNTNRATPVP